MVLGPSYRDTLRRTPQGHLRPLDADGTTCGQRCRFWVNHGRGRSRHTIVHVRFAPKADIASRHRPLTLCANSDLTHCSTTSYSITSSATKRRSRVIVSPTSLAVFSLMTNSNFVG